MKALKPKEIHLILVGWLLSGGISDAAEAEKLQVPTQVWQFVLPFGWEDAKAGPRLTPQRSVPSPPLGSGRSVVQPALGPHATWCPQRDLKTEWLIPTPRRQFRLFGYLGYSCLLLPGTMERWLCLLAPEFSSHQAYMRVFKHTATAVRLISMVQAENGAWGWLLFGQNLIKKPLDLQVWCKDLIPFLSLFSALRPQLAGSQLAFLLCSSVLCAWPIICQRIPHARRVPAAATQKRRSKKFQPRQSRPVQLARRLPPKGAGLEELPESDLFCDYTYILISEMLTLKI